MTHKTLVEKAKEYALTEDRLRNFKRDPGERPEDEWWGMAKKHFYSVMDLKDGLLPATQRNIDEKIGDLINYLHLLEAILVENYLNAESSAKYPDGTSPEDMKEKLFWEVTENKS